MEEKVARAVRELLLSRDALDRETCRRELLESIVEKVVVAGKAAEFLSEDLEALIGVEREDAEFYRQLGAEMYEVCLVLEAKSDSERVRALTSLVISRSNPRELLIAWKCATSALLSYDDSPSGFVSSIFSLAENYISLLDKCKSVTCLCLSHLVTVLQPRDFLSLITEDCEGFLTFLSRESAEASQWIAGEEYELMRKSLIGRCAEVRERGRKVAGIKIATVLLGLRMESGRDQGELIDEYEFILSFGVDALDVIATWRNWIVSAPVSLEIRVHTCRGIASFCRLSVCSSSSVRFHLPCVCSPLYRLQVYLPVAFLTMNSHIDAATELFEVTLKDYLGPFPSLFSPFLLVPDRQMVVEKCLSDLLDTIGSTADDLPRKRLLASFKLFLSLFSDTPRLHLLQSLLQSYPHDTALGLILDCYLSYSKTAALFQTHRNVMRAVEIGLRKRPAREFPNAIQSAAMLYYFQLMAGRRKKEKIATREEMRKARTELFEPAYSDLSAAYSAECCHSKLELVLASLSRVLEASRDFENDS